MATEPPTDVNYASNKESNTDEGVASKTSYMASSPERESNTDEGAALKNSYMASSPKRVDAMSEKERSINEWLPITGSRNAKWWYAAFHNVTAMVGAGVLSLPSAMADLGWGPGVTILILSWVITLYTLWQMVEMHEMVPGKRFDRYHELGQHVFGEKLGLYIVIPQQLIVEVGVDIVYMVTGGKSLKKFHDLVCTRNCKDIKLTFFIMIFGSVHFVLSHLPNFNSISGVSLAAAVMSLRGPGVTVLILSWVITLYTLWQMVEMHEMVPGKRFDRYHELGQHAFGEKLGLYIVVPQQLICEVGVDIVYMVTGGKSLKKFHDLVCTKNCKDIKLTFFIMIFASAHFVLSHLPNFNSISGVSLAAAVMSLSYSTIAWTASVHKGVQPDVQYGYLNKTTTGKVFGFFNALGDVAFAYAGHNVVLEIQATIPSTPEKPSKVPMWRGVLLAYIVVALCYFPVAIIGFWMFGNTVSDNILISLEKPTWLIAMANMFVVIHVIGSYQIYAMPVFDMIETVLVKKLNFRPTWMLRFASRNVYVAFTMFVGMTFPFFGALLGFFGGFAFAPTTYFLPCIMWLAIYKPRRFGLSWFANWICIVLGILLMIFSSIGGLRTIIQEASTYTFYS